MCTKSIKSLKIMLPLVLLTIAVGAQPNPPGPTGVGDNPPHGRLGPPQGHLRPPMPPQSPDFSLPPEPPIDNELPAKELLEQVMIARVAKQLNLSDEQTVIFVKRFMEFKESIENKTRERQILANELRKLTKPAPSENTMPLIEQQFDRLKKLDREIHDQKLEWIENVSKDYPFITKVQLYLILSDFDNEIKRYLRKAYEWRQNRPPEQGREFSPSSPGRRFRRNEPQPPENEPVPPPPMQNP